MSHHFDTKLSKEDPSLNVCDLYLFGDDVQDVMLTLASNRPIQDGAAPDRNRIRTEFPYFGEPYSKEEQKDVVPWHPKTTQ